MSAESSNQSQINTGIYLRRVGLNMEDVAHAIFILLSKIGKSDEWQPARSNHPTHKPLRLTQYLATLLLPPDSYAPRRILIPFSGAGSEIIGALLAGWEEIIGIEGQADYCEIAKARLKYWNEKEEGKYRQQSLLV